MKNYYDILGVETNESIRNIEKAYNTVVSKYNPDSFQGEAKELVEKRLADAKEAYSVLSDEFLRSQYDKELGIENTKYKEQKEQIPSPKKNITEEDQTSSENKAQGNKKEKSKIGTAKGVMDVASALYQNLSKFKFHKPTKTGVLSLIAAIIIVALIITILWFIPFTRGFIESFIIFW